MPVFQLKFEFATKRQHTLDTLWLMLPDKLDFKQWTTKRQRLTKRLKIFITDNLNFKNYDFCKRNG